MKKAFSVVVVLAMVLGMVLGISVSGVAMAQTEELKIYNWAEYMDLDLLDEFEDYYNEKYDTNLNIVYSTFDTNEVMITNIVSGDANVDLICPSEYAIERLAKMGAIKKLDDAQIPNISNIDSRIYNLVDDVFDDLVVDGNQELLSDYFVPYMWGTLGILYNTDVVTQDDIDKGWGIFWNEANNKDLNKKILLKDSIRDTFVAAVMYLKEQNRLPDGFESKPIQELINTLDDELLEKVEEVLIEQKEYLKDYEVDFGKDEMLAGRAFINLAWSGDALWAMEDGDNLDYFVPESGGNIWFDGWAMLENAPNERAAYEFINYLSDPVMAIRNSMEIGYTSAVDPNILSADTEVMSIINDNEYEVDEYFNDDIRYPEFTENLGVMKDFGDMNDKAVAMWERVKAEGSLTWVIIVVIVGVILIGGGVVAFILVRNNKGKRKIEE